MSIFRVCTRRAPNCFVCIPSAPTSPILQRYGGSKYTQLARLSTFPSNSHQASKMTSISEFKLDPTIFNQSLYKRILTLWFSTYPHPQPGNPKTDLMRWFANSDANLDPMCSSIGGPAIQSLSPSNLILPPFESIAEDRAKHAAVLAAPFLPEFTDAASRPRPRDRAEAALALVILLDQMTRNSLRDDAGQTLIYGHYDRLARAVAAAARAEGVELDKFAGDELAQSQATKSAASEAGPSVAAGAASAQAQAVQIRDSATWRFWFYMPLEHSEDVADHEQFGVELDEMERVLRANDDEPALEFMVTMRQVLGEHSEPLRRFGRYPWRNRFLGREFTADERAYIDGGGKTFGVKA